MNGPGKVGRIMPKVASQICLPKHQSITNCTLQGIWLSPTPNSAPILSLFGSTNLNSRSSHLDTELSFVMMTSSDVLRRRLQEEVRALRQWVVPWKGQERRVPWSTKVITGIVGGMLWLYRQMKSQYITQSICYLKLSLVDDRRIYCVDYLGIFGSFRLFCSFGISAGRLINVFKLSRVQCKRHRTLS